MALLRRPFPRPLAPGEALCKTVSRIFSALMLLLLPACMNESLPEAMAERSRREDPGRIITLHLWAGEAVLAAEALPRIDMRRPDGITIRGPVRAEEPETGRLVDAYERISVRGGGRRRQLLAVTQDGTGLGRLVDQRPGVPERRFAGDVVFPLGLWHAGESRRFKATEHTLFGPALRHVQLDILDLDFVHDGVPHSLAYRLTVRDEAGRVLACETSVYSPGVGLAQFDASDHWLAQADCPACSCSG